MGAFYDDGFPYTVDRLDSDPAPGVPTLAEMTRKAIEIMSVHPGGFVLQVEGGKVDWAAHVNDVGALLYDQIAFDDAVGVALVVCLPAYRYPGDYDQRPRKRQSRPGEELPCRCHV
jgi:alkaline phosphatase